MPRWFGSPSNMGYAARVRDRGDLVQLAADLALEDAIKATLDGWYDSGRSVAWLRTRPELEDTIIEAHARATRIRAARGVRA